VLESDSSAAQLRQIAILNFLTFAARGLTLPFISLYLTSLGFTGTEIGIVVGMGALAQLIVTPLSHWLADRSGQHRRLFYGLQIGHILALVGMILPFGKLWVSAINVARDSANQPGVSLLSQLTVTRLDELRRPIYGRLRAWGSFGWSVTTVFSGGIIALGGYPLLFLLGALVNIGMFPFMRALPERTSGTAKPSRAVGSRPAVFYVLLVSIALFQIGMNVSTTFGYIYFKRDLGANDGLIGLIVAAAALSEIPAMLLYERLLKRTASRTLLIAGMVGQALLWVALAALSSAPPILFLMMLRGTFYTLQNVSTVLLVSRISHPANAATHQALAQVTAPGVAVLLASPVNGWIFDHLGPRILLQGVAVIALFAAALLLVVRPQLAARERQIQVLVEHQVAD
jgi:MFS transporter, PPP family, 3-phenylpropionic acid transporter